jgi:hypothetical protein
MQVLQRGEGAALDDLLEVLLSSFISKRSAYSFRVLAILVLSIAGGAFELKIGLEK